MTHEIRHDWSAEEITVVYDIPLMELIYRAATVHRAFHDPLEVQQCTLLSIKTGGCTEDCAYCPQSARYQTGVDASPMMQVEDVMEAARLAREAGSTRFCMGAAWRELRDNEHFERILEMVRGVNGLGLEVCCTLGMLTAEQAGRLAEAGVFAYNHNIDTSEDDYARIIGTRGFDDRLKTLGHVRRSGMTVCCGGIIGLGEQAADRISMLGTLANMRPHPESVPINALVPVPGTPLGDREPVAVWEMIRMIATARIIMPGSMVRLSAGRTQMSDSDQALCFLAGANSIFTGEKLLTTPNPGRDHDQRLMETLGLRAMGRPVGQEIGTGQGNGIAN